MKEWREVCTDFLNRNRWMNAQMNKGWMDGLTDKGMIECTDSWVEEWKVGQTDGYCCEA